MFFTGSKKSSKDISDKSSQKTDLSSLKSGDIDHDARSVRSVRSSASTKAGTLLQDQQFMSAMQKMISNSLEGSLTRFLPAKKKAPAAAAASAAASVQDDNHSQDDQMEMDHDGDGSRSLTQDEDSVMDTFMARIGESTAPSSLFDSTHTHALDVDEEEITSKYFKMDNEFKHLISLCASTTGVQTPMLEKPKSFCRTITKAEETVNKEVLPKTQGLKQSLQAQLDKLKRGLAIKSEYVLSTYKVPKQFKVFDTEEKDRKVELAQLNPDLTFGLRKEKIKPPHSYMFPAKQVLSLEQLVAEMGQLVSYLDHFRTASLSILETVSSGLKANMPDADDNPIFDAYVRSTTLPNLQDLVLLSSRSSDMLDSLYQGHASLTAQIQLTRRDATLKSSAFNKLNKEHKNALRLSAFGETFLFDPQAVAGARVELNKASEKMHFVSVMTSGLKAAIPRSTTSATSGAAKRKASGGFGGTPKKQNKPTGTPAFVKKDDFNARGKSVSFRGGRGGGRGGKFTAKNPK